MNFLFAPLHDVGKLGIPDKVSWNGAQEFIKRLSRRTGKQYRLPSEAEREYAARAGTQTAYWWGDKIITDQANFNGDSYDGNPNGNNRKTTVAVRSFAPNSWGLYNLHGNLWEWVQDCDHKNYVRASTDGSAWESASCADRVQLGGSWDNGQAYAQILDGAVLPISVCTGSLY